MPIPTTSELRALLRLTHSDAAISAALEEAAQVIERWAGPEGSTTNPLIATWRQTAYPFVQTLNFPHFVGSVTSLTIDGTAFTRFEINGRELWRTDGGYWVGVIQATYVPTDEGAIRYQVAVDLANLRLSWTPLLGLSWSGGSRSFDGNWMNQQQRILSRLTRGRAPEVLPDLIVLTDETQPVTPTVVDNLYIGTIPTADATIDLSSLTPVAFPGRLTIPTFTGSRHVFVAQRHDRTDLISFSYVGGFPINQLGTFVKRSDVTTVNEIEYDAWVSRNPLLATAVSGRQVEVAR